MAVLDSLRFNDPREQQVDFSRYGQPGGLSQFRYYDPQGFASVPPPNVVPGPQAPRKAAPPILPVAGGGDGNDRAGIDTSQADKPNGTFADIMTDIVGNLAGIASVPGIGVTMGNLEANPDKTGIAGVPGITDIVEAATDAMGLGPDFSDLGLAPGAVDVDMGFAAGFDAEAMSPGGNESESTAGGPGAGATGAGATGTGTAGDVSDPEGGMSTESGPGSDQAGGGGQGDDDDTDCYVTTALVDEGLWSPEEKRTAIRWCMKTHHKDGDVWRDGYHVWGKQVARFARHCKMFRVFVKWCSTAFIQHETGNPSFLGFVIKWGWVQPLSYTIGRIKLWK